MPDKIKLIYLMGSGHCGSTLLDILMGCHSKIIGIGEFYNFTSEQSKVREARCICGKTWAQCPFWSKLVSEVDCAQGINIHRTKINFLLNRQRYFIKDKNKTRISVKDYLRLNEQIYKKISEYSQKDIIFDSSKFPNRAELLCQSRYLDVILLHLVRDGRGVTWSYKRKYGGHLPFTWLRMNLKAEIVKRRNKNVKNIFVRYEDLVREPERELKRILKQIGLVFEPRMLNFWHARQHQLAGNFRVLKGDNKIKEDLSWQKNLSRLDLFLFYFFAGPLHKFYGY